MTEHSNQPPLTPAVFHILLALSTGPAHGYAIMKRVEEESRIKMGPGTVYGSLERLTSAGWVEETDSERANRRRGSIFQLTPEGTEALRAEAGRITRLARLEGVRGLAPDPGS